MIEGIRGGVGENQRDIPFSLLYLYDDGDGHDGGCTRAQLAGATGIELRHPAAVAEMAVGDDNQAWPATAIRARPEHIIFDDLGERFNRIRTGAWNRAPHFWRPSVSCPITQAAQERATGFLVAATNPYRAAQERLPRVHRPRSAGQIAANLANAPAPRARATPRRGTGRARPRKYAVLLERQATISGRRSRCSSVPPKRAREPDTAGTQRASRSIPSQRNASSQVGEHAARLLAHRGGPHRRGDQSAPTSRSSPELASSFRSVIEKAGFEARPRLRADRSHVYVDRDMWEKIVLNLVSNAFKHTFDGKFWCPLAERDGAAELVVRDTGIGM